MTLCRVVFSRVASDQAAEIDAWWVAHRPAAPELFLRELGAAVEVLRRAPLLGSEYTATPIAGVRRMLIGRSRYHVYWEFDPGSRTVTITAVWHAERGSGPRL